MKESPNWNDGYSVGLVAIAGFGTVIMSFGVAGAYTTTILIALSFLAISASVALLSWLSLSQHPRARAAREHRRQRIL
jgi:hypothetical protein